MESSLLVKVPVRALILHGYAVTGTIARDRGVVQLATNYGTPYNVIQTLSDVKGTGCDAIRCISSQIQH